MIPMRVKELRSSGAPSMRDLPARSSTSLSRTRFMWRVPGAMRCRRKRATGRSGNRRADGSAGFRMPDGASGESDPRRNLPHEIRCVSCGKLLSQVGSVELDGSRTDIQCASHFLAGMAGCDARENFVLSRRQIGVGRKRSRKDLQFPSPDSPPAECTHRRTSSDQNRTHSCRTPCERARRFSLSCRPTLQSLRAGPLSATSCGSSGHRDTRQIPVSGTCS